MYCRQRARPGIAMFLTSTHPGSPTPESPRFLGLLSCFHSRNACLLGGSQTYESPYTGGIDSYLWDGRWGIRWLLCPIYQHIGDVLSWNDKCSLQHHSGRANRACVCSLIRKIFSFPTFPGWSSYREKPAPTHRREANKMRKHIQLLLVGLLMVALVPIRGAAQATASGTIQGTVTDPSGAVVVGAQVQATQRSIGTVRTTTSSDSGSFRFDLLPASLYEVKVTKVGFGSFVQRAE